VTAHGSLAGEYGVILEAVGWTARWAAVFAEHADAGCVPGRVIAEHRTHYQVATVGGELTAQSMGRLRHDAALRSDLPGVGDFVAVRPSDGDGPATIEAVLPRTSALIRKASGKETPQMLAANVDVVFIVTGMDGDFNLERLKRFVALVMEGRSRPVIVANKAEVAEDIALALRDVSAMAPDVAVHAVSACTGAGLDQLAKYFDGGQTIVLVGSSGVGKSTLTNRLLEREAQATGAVREHDSRGRHTTTHRHLFIRPKGGVIIDTPGMRGLEAWSGAEPVRPSYDDVATIAAACKFSNCRHATEPGCAVRAAIERGELDPARVDAFLASTGKPSRRA
jgi:ribosome biogenesis GTPase / thiamine phosphate phosphatase